jgi:hypothetical protein
MRKLDAELNPSSAIGSTFTFMFSFLPFPGDAEGYYNETGSPFFDTELFVNASGSVRSHVRGHLCHRLFLSSVGPFPSVP